MKKTEIDEQIQKVEKHHGYLSSGALLGIPMINYACDLLGCELEDDIFVTVETTNCLPDAIEALTRCRIGNKRLTIRDVGKFAISASKKWDEKGIRVFIDVKKLKNYPVIYDWYMNIRKVPHEEVLPEIMKAWTDILSYREITIEIPPKKKKIIEICEGCGEPYTLEKEDNKEKEKNLCDDCFDRTSSNH